MTPFPRAPYRPLEPYAPDRRPIPVDLSDNTNRWGTHPAALRVVREAEPEALLRYPPVYADALKGAVARRFGVGGDAVSTGCGSDDLLDSVFRAACDPGEGVCYLPPTFSMIEIFARMNGLEPRPVERPGPGPEAPFGTLPDPDRLLAERPGLIYLCRPNNPTGEVVPARWVQDLLARVGDDGPVVVLDEAYVDFLDDPAEELVKMAVASRRALVLRTLSKAYGLAGLRVGFALGAPEVIRELEKSRGPYKVSRLAEAAAVAALEDREGWVPEIVGAAREERARLVRELTARGLPPLPSGANFACLPLAGTPLARAHGPDEPDSAALQVTAALRERGVAVRPFPALPGIGEAIRISVGPTHEIDAFLQALDEVLS
jgi:histidinol-phosphate aminotransferase